MMTDLLKIKKLFLSGAEENQTLALVLFKNTQVGSLNEFWDLIMKDLLTKEIFDLFSIDEESLCKHCEDFILETKRCSQFFMCEGRWCEFASESYLEKYLPKHQKEFELKSLILEQ